MARKKRRSEKFNITISSQNDALRSPTSFVVRRSTIILVAVLVLCVFAMAAYLSANVFVYERNMDQTEQQMKILIDEQREALEHNAAQIEQLEQNQRDLEQKLKDAGAIGAAMEMKPLTEDSPDFSRSSAATETAGEGPMPAKQTVKRTTQFGNGSTNGRVELAGWFDGGSEMIPRYSQAVVIDVETGKSFDIWRFGGTYHADSEPLTAQDTQIMKEIWGGQWSWNRRAIWVKVGDRFFAASMHGMPHMVNPSPHNNFDGHFCIHFLGSMVHATDAQCPRHQEQVMIAFTSAQKLDDYMKTYDY